MENKVISVIPKNLKDTDGCCGCKHINEAIEIWNRLTKAGVKNDD